jgi:hypothetical protein
LLALLLAAFGSGCVSEQHSEFRGTITRGITTTNIPMVKPIGAEFQSLNPSFTNALTGFGVSEGDFLIVHDRQKYVNNDYRLSNDAVSAVYFYELKKPINPHTFLDEDTTARDRTLGMYRLQGSFNVEKWKSNIDFRIRLAMQSSETNPVVVNGVLTTYNSWEFNPIKAIALTLGAMGIAGE